MATAPVLPAVPASQFASKNDASHAPINLVQLDFTLDNLLPSTHGDPATLAVQDSEMSLALCAQEPEPPIRASDGPKKLLSRARPTLHLLTDASLVSAAGSSHTHDAELVSDDGDDSETDYVGGDNDDPCFPELYTTVSDPGHYTYSESVSHARPHPIWYVQTPL